MDTTTQKKSSVRFTYHDYTLLSEDKRYEIIEGDLYMTPSPTTIHQRISAAIGLRLAEFILKNKLGEILYAPMDVVLSDEDVIQPDILFISNDRKGIVKPENIRGAPDLVVEILSPSTANRDLVTKKKLYARHAVREYWIVNPNEKTVEVMTWTEQGFKTVQVYPRGSRLASPLLAGFSLSMDEIF